MTFFKYLEDQKKDFDQGPRSNYSYFNPNLVDKCSLRKEVHGDSWLV